MRAWAFALVCAASSCRAREPEQLVARPVVAPSVSASSEPAIDPGPWTPLPKAPAGRVWRAVHQETLHFAIAVPTDGKVEVSHLPFGHPVVYADAGPVRVQITFSSGMAMVGKELAASPPTFVKQKVERISRTDDNVAIAYRSSSNGLTVKGWVRGVECASGLLKDDQRDAAFDLCASLRLVPLGPAVVEVEAALRPFPRVPKDVHVEGKYGVTMMYAGHFSAKVLARACPNEAELRANDPSLDAELARRALPHGPVLVSREYQTWQGYRYRAATHLWAERAGRCCIATFPEFFTPPTEPQIDWVAAFCDRME